MVRSDGRSFEAWAWYHACHVACLCRSVTAHHVMPSVELSNGQVLTATPNHMVYASSINATQPNLGRCNLMALGDVSVGDTMWYAFGLDGLLVPTQVIAKRRTATTGMYAPHTASGTLLVDGLLTSAYASNMVPSKWVGDLYLTPFRWLHWLVGSNFMMALNEVVLSYAHDAVANVLIVLRKLLLTVRFPASMAGTLC